MESLYKKYKLQSLCIIIAAMIVAIAAVCGICFESQKANTEPVSSEATENYTSGKTISVTVKADGQKMKLLTVEAEVGDILSNYGIPLGEDDKISPDKDTVAEDGMEIVIQRIEYKTETVEEKVPYKTVTKGVSNLPKGTSKVVTEGKNGKDEVTYKVEYTDGVETAREEVSRKTVKEPVTEVIEKSTVGTIKGREYSRKFTVKAYSYTGGGTTASGKPAAVGRIAVDPRVIPLGTKVYVEGYGFAEAADTGGNIKGNTIDVYFNSIRQCRQWGVRHITIYILK